MDENALRECLLRENAEFRRLTAEHKALEEALSGLRGRPVLSEAESLQERDLKKRKLVIKDELYRMMSECRKRFGDKGGV